MRHTPVQALLFCAVLLLPLTLTPAAVRAELYSYVDANGVHHYTNVPGDARYKRTETPTRASRQSVTAITSATKSSSRPSSRRSAGRAERVSNEERLLQTIANRSSSARPTSRAGGAMYDRFFFDEYAAGLRGRGRVPVRVLGRGYNGYGADEGVGYGGVGNYDNFSRRRGAPFSYTYTRPARGWGFSDYFAQASYPATPEHINEHIRQAARTYGLDPMLIKAVIKTESNFNVNALSPKGARGLMQLMPGTARDMNVRNAFDPRDNIFGGARYLRMMLDQFGGDVALSLAAYNAGPNRVAATWTIPNIAETKNYVVKVMRHYRAYKGGAEARPARRPPTALTRVFARNTEDDTDAPRTRPASIRVKDMVTVQ